MFNALGECNLSWVTKFNSRLLIVVTFLSIAATLTVEHARRATRQYAKSVRCYRRAVLFLAVIGSEESS